MIKVAVVKCSNEKTCFVAIPRNWSSSTRYGQHVYEVKKKGKKAYLSWNGRTTAAEDVDVIEINREYCHCLGFAENDMVSVQEITKTIPNCNKAFLKPPNADGFEVIGLNKNAIELRLMAQIKVIWDTQVFPLWINNIQVLIEVYDTLPCNFPVMLVNETVLHIDDVNETASQSSTNNLKLTEQIMYNNYTGKSKHSYLKDGMAMSLLSKGLNHFLGWIEITEYKDQLQQNDNTKLLSNKSINLILRVNPVEDHLFVSECVSHYEMKYKLRGINYPSTVYISSTILPDNGRDISEMFLAKISKLLSPSEKVESKINDKQGARRSASEKRKYLSSSNDSSSATNFLNKEKHFSSSIVQVIVLTDIERSCSSCIKDELNITLESGSVIIPDCLRKMLGLEIGCCIHLQNIDYMPSALDTIHLYPLSSLKRSSAMNITSIFTSWFESVYDNSLPFIFCNGNVVTLPIENGSVDFVLVASLGQENGNSVYHPAEKDDNLKTYWNISPSFLSRKVSCKLETIFTPVNVNGISLPSPLLCLIDNKVEGLDASSLGGIKALFEKGWQFLELWLNLSPMSKSLLPAKEHNAILLVCGPKGIGKTAFCQALCKKVTQSPHHVYCHYISCRTLKGKRGEILWKNWKESCLNAIYREPTVLLIDDLDLIASAPTTPEEEVAANGIYFQKIVHAFLNLCDYIKSSGAKVVIIVTAKSFQSLHPLLTSTRGKHMFQCKIEITCPSKDQREHILKALVESKLNVKLDEANLFKKLALKTEGFVAQDLDTLVNRATHVALMKNDLSLINNQPIEVNLMEADFNAALQNFIPSSLQSVHLHKSGNKQWSDVGGLSAVKDTLHKMLLWPAKYPFLFTNCPLRLQSGILLYGPPGTGKTLIAGVLAKESGLNFIHIKGPELLSKYIGASEQALRNAFANAQSAKPCILFFDEFDALAPRRGHDSTGVTDRVVNQMLTQMDGVESLNGVYILAATSRPDLIDPALLRPGRLDKHLYCPLPDKDERLQILQALSQKLYLSEDVDLPAIADLTTNFSGADLQALLYSAQIESIHHVHSNSNQEKNEQSNNEDLLVDHEMIYFPSIEEGSAKLDSETQKRIKNEVAIIQKNISNSEQIKAEDYDKPSLVYINQKNLMAALDKMRPSVSASERTKYQFIYSRFGRGGSDAPTLPDFGGKRVTLA